MLLIKGLTSGRITGRCFKFSIPVVIVEESSSVVDPDLTYHFDTDPDPSFQIKAQNFEKVLK
jgi:hypothetical protein